MLRFDAKKMEQEALRNLSDGDEIIALADRLHKEGYSNVFFIGVGGTYTYAMIMDANLRAYTAMPYYAEHAADFNTMGNRRFNAKSIVIVASATGSLSMSAGTAGRKSLICIWKVKRRIMDYGIDSP